MQTEETVVDIIHRIGIKAPVSKVYEAVATAAGVAGWWTSDTNGSSKAGGKVQVHFRHHDGNEIGQMDFEVIQLEPDWEVRWRFLAGPPEWIGTDATFQLSQDGDMTVLVFGHRNWREPNSAMLAGRTIDSPR